MDIWLVALIALPVWAVVQYNIIRLAVWSALRSHAKEAK